jgi:hypothetical protein
VISGAYRQTLRRAIGDWLKAHQDKLVALFIPAKNRLSSYSKTNGPPRSVFAFDAISTQKMALVWSPYIIPAHFVAPVGEGLER